MKTSSLRIGIVHSIIGKNDGVSIVIDQSVKAMMEHMNIPLGNFYFLTAYAPPRFNVTMDEIFWHKNDINKLVVGNFCSTPPDGFEKNILSSVLYAKKIISSFVEENQIDLILAHNTSHPYNFITAVALSMYLEQRRSAGRRWPKYVVWWHDSFYERDIFSDPNEVVAKYLRHLPGPNADGIVFINSLQVALGRKYFQELIGDRAPNDLLKKRTSVIPNTFDIEWDWKSADWHGKKLVAPPQDSFNRTFFKDIGMDAELAARRIPLSDCILLLQHTRVVARKRIDKAIDFAFLLEKKFRANGAAKCMTIVVSGASGDEQSAHKEYLIEHHRKMSEANPDSTVLLFFAENCVLSGKDVMVDKKFYSFFDIPSIIAAHGGMGLYFSEIEGFGNNLLEMVGGALPVVINKYETYKTDVEKYGFKFPSTTN